MALLKLCETVIPDLKVRPYYRNKLCKQDYLLLARCQLDSIHNQLGRESP